MALKPCRECGNQVSTSVRKCPHCGKRNPTTSPVWSTIYAIGLIIFLLMVMTSGGSSSNRSNGYSRQYNNDISYRNTVDDVANTYGASSREVDAAIQRIANEAVK